MLLTFEQFSSPDFFQLVECLKNFNLFETDEEMHARIEVLRKLNSLVKIWVRKVSESKVCCFLLRHTTSFNFWCDSFSFRLKCAKMLVGSYSLLAPIDLEYIQEVGYMVFFIPFHQLFSRTGVTADFTCTTTRETRALWCVIPFSTGWRNFSFEDYCTAIHNSVYV